jgi:hypothetical protein
MSAHAHKPRSGNDLPIIRFSIFSTDVPEGTLLQIAVVFLQEHFMRQGRPDRHQSPK